MKREIPAAIRPEPGDRLRIIHCFRDPTGGLFRHVRDLCWAQSKAGHLVGIICDSTTGGPLEERLLAELAPSLALGITRVPMRRQIGLSDFSGARRVLAAARPLSPDVLHGHGAKGGAYARIAGTILRSSGRRVARVYTPHGGSLHFDRRRLRHRVYFRAERMLERLTDAFIFVSRYEADAFAAKVRQPRRPARIIPNGLREEEFIPVRRQPDARPFVYIGMLRDLKGPDVFIDALALLRGRRRPHAAHIFGSGEDAANYRAQVDRLGLSGAVAFHEPRPAREAFAAGEVLVVPSRAESMPYIVLEAAAAEVPMVATKVGGIPEIFRQQAGRLVEPGDAEALARAMEAASTGIDRARRDAAALRQIVAAVHTVEVMAAEAEDVYRKVLIAEARASGRSAFVGTGQRSV
jgi:glycosyltransferase involved in cell wall biosynthesis